MTGAELERPVRAQLRTLSKANAEIVSRHLVMTARLLPEDPQLAYAHAMAAQRRAGRIAVVREAVGVAAYHAGLWAEALSELRAARRMSGSSHQLPLMADAERGLGRPERALELATSPEAASLTEAERVELAIVVSGARRDLGQADAAVLALQIPELTATATHAYTPRLRYAYAAALLDAGRRDEALAWFARAADSDQDGETDAEERLTELQGIVITDLAEDADDDSDDAADGAPAAGEAGRPEADDVPPGTDAASAEAEPATAQEGDDAEPDTVTEATDGEARAEADARTEADADAQGVAEGSTETDVEADAAVLARSEADLGTDTHPATEEPGESTSASQAGQDGPQPVTFSDATPPAGPGDAS